MCESNENCGWFGSWIQAAKDKSYTTLELIKKDLTEFTTTVSEDTSRAATAVRSRITQENATAAKEKVKVGMNSLIGGIQKALIVKPDDDDTEAVRIVDGVPVPFDRAKAKLYAVQVDIATYTTDPEDSRYADFCSEFSADERKGDISSLLVDNVEMRALYTQLVPSPVSNNDFWSRYFFRCRLLEEDEARRLELMKRAEVIPNETEIDWDEDDEPSSAEVGSEDANDKSNTDTELESQLETCVKPEVHGEEGVASQKLTAEVTDKSKQQSLTPPVEIAEKHDPNCDIKPTTLAERSIPVPGETPSSTDPSVGSPTTSDNGISWPSTNDTSDQSSVTANVEPTPASTDSATKSQVAGSTDEDWEKEFDITEEELQKLEKTTGNDDENADDWEDW